MVPPMEYLKERIEAGHNRTNSYSFDTNHTLTHKNRDRIQGLFELLTINVF